MTAASHLLQQAIVTAINAGNEILKIYNGHFEVTLKSDNTPVTKADKAASDLIIRELSPHGINVLSEEGELFTYHKRKNWEDIWIVDPLDGTKEFVKRNGEFTINIALVKSNRPVIGVIYSPVFKHLYFAEEGFGSYKVDPHLILEEINSERGLNTTTIINNAERLPLKSKPQVYTIVASRSHLSKEVSLRIKELELKYGKVDIINTGSSIKFCLVAEGSAHEYPRFGNTMEWDTAAGQCIVEQAGGSVIDLQTGLPISYNRENLLNNNFIVFCNN